MLSERFEAADLKDGQKVVFRVVGKEILDIRSTHEMRYWDGIVNGDPIEDGEGSFFVQLWCDRESREATNVMVHSTNLVAILPKGF